jgi:hypothetical protein
MSGNVSPGRDSPVLSPLPPPPAASGRGYHWATALVGILTLGAVVLVGIGWFTIPGIDPVRAGAWTFALSLLIVLPAGIVVLLASLALVAILRRCGARTWPGVVQALPAVAVVLGLLYLLVRWLFSGPEVS